MKFDLHVHTKLSLCSQLSLDTVIDQAQARGLDGVCITDHDTMAVNCQLREGIQVNGLCVIFGMEYATTEGDFLLFGSFEDIPLGLAAPEMLRHVEAAGGVAVAAHPFRLNRPTQEYLIREGLCTIVEGINGRNQQNENEQVAGWEGRYNVKQVGGSDAHTIGELGQVTTLFSDTIRNRFDLIQALKDGSYAPQRNLNILFAVA